MLGQLDTKVLIFFNIPGWIWKWVITDTNTNKGPTVQYRFYKYSRVKSQNLGGYMGTMVMFPAVQIIEIH